MDKMFRPEMRVALEVPVIFDSNKEGKSIPISLLDAGYDFVNNKINIKLKVKTNKIKEIMKVIKSLENKGILLKGTTRKIPSQYGGFLNFIRPLMKAAIPLHFLIKNVITILAKKNFSTTRINNRSFSNRCSHSKEFFWIRYDCTYNFQ